MSKGESDTRLLSRDLAEVSTPALVARYRAALRHLTGRETMLSRFHIDLAGHSPEIAAELEDEFYLAPDGAQRPFILLGLAQCRAPMLQGRDTVAETALRRYIEADEAQIMTLTAQDAVVGEIRDGVFAPSTPAAIALPRQPRLNSAAVGPHIAKPEALAQRVSRFLTEPEAWRDEALISALIDGAAPASGPLASEGAAVPQAALPERGIEVGSLWTADFGGAYVFAAPKRGEGAVTVFSRAPESLGITPLAHQLTLTDPVALDAWLRGRGLVEPKVTGRGASVAADLRRQMDFILLSEADRLGLDPEGAGRAALRRDAAELGPALPDAYMGLAEVLGWAEGRGDWPVITSRHPAYFHLLRATEGPQAWLVEMLLAELAGQDLYRLWHQHPRLFRRRLAGWGRARRARIEACLAAETGLDATPWAERRRGRNSRGERDSRGAIGG